MKHATLNNCLVWRIDREHFTGQPVFNACYAHAWDPTRTKLLCVGGPLAYGLRGSYMALWE